MTQTPKPLDSTPQPKPELWQFASPKLYIPGVTQGRKPKLNWRDNQNEIDILTSRLADEADEFFNQ
jgi:hypothetical protein